MKKNFVYAMIGAIALTGAVGLISCTDEDVVDVNPSYNPETGEVTTDFVFNVSRSMSSTTRMSAATTQATLDQKFRGIDNANLMSVKLGITNDGKWVKDVGDNSTTTTTGEGEGATTTTTYNSKLFNMGEIMSAEYIDPDGTGDNVNKSHRIIELSLPAETNTLLFWGKAIKTGTDLEQGFTKMTIPTDMNLGDFEFRLKKVVPEDEPSNPFRRDALLQYQDMIAAIMTFIIRSNTTWTEGTGDQAVNHPIAWVDYISERIETTGEGESATTYAYLQPKIKDPGNTEANMSALGEILAEAYCSFNTIYPNELRAGYGEAILKMINDLYIVIGKVANAIPTSNEEKCANSLANRIKDNIDLFFASDASSWKPMESVISSVKANCPGFADVEGVNTKLNLIQTDNSKYPLVNFPVFFNLPKGAVILENDYDKYAEAGDGHQAGDPILDERGNKMYYYKYMGTVPTYAMGGPSTSGSSENNSGFDPRNYMFPPELCYFGNSPIRVTDDTHQPDDYPNGAGNGDAEWMNESSWAAGATGEGSKAWTKDGHVLSTTRSVAMQHNINYGTAMLQTTVKYGVKVLEDNNAAIQLNRKGAVEGNNKIDVSGATPKFALTGILVGGQNPVVGWNYIAKSGGVFGAMVYDKLSTTNIPNATDETGGSQTAPIYTLVWDNYEIGESSQRVVYLALEFVNNSSKDFWGQNNLIRNGGTFYLIAKLDPDQMPAGFVIPEGETGAGAAATVEQFRSNKGWGITWPTDYALPPYNSDGSTVKERRVFIQDHKTIANLKFNETSLQHALVAVPDLRSAQISLGLSVDMEWRSGLTFDDVILGQ